jgi:hypothetical protein
MRPGCDAANAPEFTHIKGSALNSNAVHFSTDGTKPCGEIAALAWAPAVSRDGRYLALGAAFGLGNFSPLPSLLAPSKGKAIIYQLK